MPILRVFIPAFRVLTAMRPSGNRAEGRRFCPLRYLCPLGCSCSKHFFIMIGLTVSDINHRSRSTRSSHPFIVRAAVMAVRTGH